MIELQIKCIWYLEGENKVRNFVLLMTAFFWGIDLLLRAFKITRRDYILIDAHSVAKSVTYTWSVTKSEYQ